MPPTHSSYKSSIYVFKPFIFGKIQIQSLSILLEKIILYLLYMFRVILKAHGKFILPEQVPANEFLNLEGEKISTSRNHAIWLHEYFETFPDKVDVLHYVLCTIMPENKDSEFTWQDFQDKNNRELLANLGC